MAKAIPQTSPAPTNLGSAERTLSIALGAALLLRAVGGAVLGPLALGIGGAMLVWRGVSGYCPVKAELCGHAGAPASERRRARHRAGAADPVTRASEDSFPASDPPSWTATNGPLRRH